MERTYTDPNIATYIKTIRKIPVLTREDEVRLFHDMRSTDDQVRSRARKTLIESNQRLVLTFTVQKAKIDDHFWDILQQGMLGLITAIDRFDIDRGLKLSTYASWWIYRYIYKEFYAQRNIRLPSNRIELKRQIERERAILEKEMGREVSSQEIAYAMDMSLDLIDSIVSTYQDTVSIDNGDVNYEQFISDEGDQSDDILIRNETCKKVQDYLEDLDMEGEILYARYRDDLSLSDIGERFNLSGEKIRKLIKHRLKKAKAQLQEESM